MGKRRWLQTIAAAGIIAVLVIVSVVVAVYRPDFGWHGNVQAHEDGTVHLHPSPTPTPATPTPAPTVRHYPTPTPTPAPLKGQPQLSSTAYYNRTNHALDLTSHVQDAPKRTDGWHIEELYGETSLPEGLVYSGEYHVSFFHQGWSAESRCSAIYQEPIGDSTYGVMSCSLPLPEHWNLEQITSSLVIPVRAYGPTFGRDPGKGIYLEQTIWVDLFVRDNWTE